MVPTPSKPRAFEECEIPTEGSDRLHAKLLFPKPPIFPKRFVLAPPLVGGSAAQALIIFRNLAKRGCILASFEYRGHPRSTGVFDLDKTVVDTRYALHWAADYAREHGLPLHAFAMCYAFVPLAANFAAGLDGCRLWSLATISGLFRMDQIVHITDFAPLISKHLGRELDVAALIEALEEDTLDWNGQAFRAALCDFLRHLFPTQSVSQDHFEEIQFDRIDMRSMLLQLTHRHYLDGTLVPPEVPCHVVYGRHDTVMGLDSPEGREAYRRRVRALAPHAVFHELEIDHFGLGLERALMVETVGDAFEEAEVRAVSLEMGSPTSSLQDAHP